MGIKYDVIPSTWTHAVDIATAMRASDVAEVWATGHYTPSEAVAKSFLASRDTARTGLVDGKPVVICGIAHGQVIGVGHPWLLATPELRKHSKRFLVECKKFMLEARKDYDLLHNWVHAKNVSSIRWLRWLGFELDDAAHFGPDRELFHHFYMEIDRAADQGSQPAA